MDNPDFQIKLDSFEGPLDLLLYLIEEQELDIYEVKLSEVTEQYLAYIYQARTINLDIASEFLIMAARLLQMKVRRLLPSTKSDPEDEEIENFEEELFRQLAEYKKYKDIVSLLKEKHLGFSKYAFRDIDEEKIIKEFVNENPLENCTIEDLTNAFRNVMKNITKTEPVIEIVKENYSVSEASDEIMNILQKRNGDPKGIIFSELFYEKDTKTKIIIIFLALLELIKNRKVKAIQNHNFNEIYIMSVSEEV
jgi:segregation and condensation protein A